MAPLYHGGAPGIYRGRLLLPPVRTGAPTIADVTSDGVCRRDRVYLTAELEVARLFACMYPPRGGGWVYEVEPIGEVEADPHLRLALFDADPGQSFAITEGRVLRVVDRGVRQWGGMSFRQVLRASEGALQRARPTLSLERVV